MTKRIRVENVRVTIGGVEVEGFESFTFRPEPVDPTLPLRWAAWFDSIWEYAGRRRDPGSVGMPLEAVRIGHRRMARGEVEPFPMPAQRLEAA